MRRRRSFSKCDPARQVSRAAAAVAEAMERRRLLSAVLGAEGTLTVTGTSLADQIRVTIGVPPESPDGVGTVEVRENGVLQIFTTPAVKGVLVNALGGDDAVVIDGGDSVSGGGPGVQYINSTVRGGDGNDRLESLVLDGGGGGPSDSLDGGAGDDYLFVQHDGQVTLSGGDGDDVFDSNGNQGVTIAAFGGNGDDTVYADEDSGVSFDGGAGLNTLDLQHNNSPGIRFVDLNDPSWVNVHNIITGDNAFNLKVIGSPLPDHVFLGQGGRASYGVNIDLRGGDDTIDGAGYESTLIGGDGRDLISVSEGDRNTIFGGNGDDTIQVRRFVDVTISGGAGNDRLEADGEGGSTASLAGDTGNDTLGGGHEADRFSGGAGIDTVDYSSRTSRVTVGIGSFADDGEAGEADNVLTDNEVILGGSGADCLKGNAAGEQLFGNSGDDTLLGQGGADSIFGGAGNDLIDGGSGADFMRGGAGSGDTVDYSTRTGRLVVGIGVFADDGEAGEHDNVYQDIERVRGGSGGDSISGNAASNVLFGNGGNDTLSGGGGVDALFGGVGNDTMFAKDGKQDYIDGGLGTDDADTDDIDTRIDV